MNRNPMPSRRTPMTCFQVGHGLAVLTVLLFLSAASIGQNQSGAQSPVPRPAIHVTQVLGFEPSWWEELEIRGYARHANENIIRQMVSMDIRPNLAVLSCLVICAALNRAHPRIPPTSAKDRGCRSPISPWCSSNRIGSCWFRNDRLGNSPPSLRKSIPPCG